jgi:phosphohistidine phosphatase
MLKLFLLRHAKSSWKDSALDDFDRPLKDKGVNEALFIGNVYRKIYDKVPDAIISSPAIRAIETAKIFAKEIGYPEDKIVLQQEIYEATHEALVRVLRSISEKYKRVVIVGHNPGFTELANYIIDGVDIDNIPTCGLVGIKIDTKKWVEVGERSGKLISFEYPKKY